MSTHIHVHVYIHVALNILCMCACRTITSDPYSRRHDSNWRYRVIDMSVTISRHPSKLKVVQCTLERPISRLKKLILPDCLPCCRTGSLSSHRPSSNTCLFSHSHPRQSFSFAFNYFTFSHHWRQQGWFT